MESIIQKRKLMCVCTCALAFATGAVAEGLNARAYVQDGLVLMYDGIDNVGVGKHNAEAKTWRNLAYGTTNCDLSVEKLISSSWTETYLALNSGAAKTGNQLITPSQVTLGSRFTFEVMAYTSDGQIRRWEAEPWLQGFESWSTAQEGYLERINGTRFTCQSTLLTKEILAFTTTYNQGTHSQYLRREDGSLSSKSAAGTTYSYTGKLAFCSTLAAGGRAYAIRAYTRVLSEQERAYNSALDQIRFQGRTAGKSGTVVLPNSWWFDQTTLSLKDANDTVLVQGQVAEYVWTGKAGDGKWSSAGNWSTQSGAAVTAAPIGGTFVFGETAAVTVDVADLIADALWLTDGAQLTIPEGIVLKAQEVYCDNVAFGRAILSGTGAKSERVDWIAGAGSLRIAGANECSFPSVVPTPAADGWYEFGLAEGYGSGYTTGSPSHASTKLWYIDGERRNWDVYAYPKNAKLRLVGGILLEKVPNWFGEIDQSQMKLVYLGSPYAFADGRAIELHSGCVLRYLPGSWEDDGDRHWYYKSDASQPAVTSDIAFNGGKIHVHGDGITFGQPTFAGDLSGTGDFATGNFSKQGRFTGLFGAVLTISDQQSNANLIWVDTTNVTGRITSATLNGCGGQWITNKQYCACGVMFGRDGTVEAEGRELSIGTLNGSGGSYVEAATGKRWRSGGEVIVWGNNTVRIGTLSNGLHALARRQDQDCTTGYFSRANCVGTGNLAVDDFKSGTIFASTNVNLKIGKMQKNTKVDYTFQANAVNNMVLEVTNSCDTTAQVLATDLAMLPARLKGFTGSVKLTDTETKTYPVTIDLSQGAEAVCNRGGCDGSGTLASAPENGTIDVTLAETDAPESGEYAVARFTSGGDKLASWTVTLGGQAATECFVGAGEKLRRVTLKRDTTGIYLKVSRVGMQVLLF